MEIRASRRTRDIFVVVAFVLTVAGLVLAGRGSDSPSTGGRAPAELAVRPDDAEPTSCARTIPSVADVYFLEFNGERSVTYETDNGFRRTVRWCGRPRVLDADGASIDPDEIAPGTFVRLTFMDEGITSVEVLAP